MESLLWSGRRLIGSGARRRAVSGQRSAQAPGRPIPQSAALLILPQKSTETADLLSHQSSPVLSALQRPDRAPNIAEHNGRIIRWSRRRTKRCATRWSPRTWQARPCDDCSRSFPDQLDLALPGGLGQRVAGVTRRAPGARPGDTSRGAAPAWGATPARADVPQTALVAPWPDHPVRDPQPPGDRRHHCPSCPWPKSSLLTWSASSMGRARMSWPPSSNKPQQERACDCDATGPERMGIAGHFGRSPSGFRKGHLLIGTAHKYADGHVLYRREAIRTTRGVTLARPPCDLRGRTLA